MKLEPDKYRHLIENLPDAFAYHQVATDEEGAPVDYVFLEINDAFEEMTGLKRDEVIGKKVTAVLPRIEKSGFDWIGTYGRIAQSNDSACFKQCAELLGRWYEVAAYSCEPGYFATVFHDITEHKRTETEILESKRNLEETTQRLNDILRSTKTGVDIIDAHYNLHYVDSLWQKVYGQPAGRKCYEYFNDRNSPCETCGIPRALATKQVILSEQVLPKENNRIVEVHTTPFQNPQGEWLVAEFKIDITERKRVEQALKESETKFRSYINNAPYGVFVHNEKGDFLEANKMACLMSGYSEEELAGMNLSQLIPQADQQRSRENFHVLTEQGSVYFEIPHIHKDGTLRDWSVNVVKLSDTRFLGFTLDVTEKRQAEIKLKKSEERFYMLAEHSLTIVWEVDSNGLYTYVSHIAEKLLGYRPEELIGKKHFYDLHPEDGQEAFKNAAFEIFARKASFRNLENCAQSKASDIVWLNKNGIPLLDEHGDLIGYQGSDTDITERKDAEKKIRYLSFHDSLTGLYNRIYLEKEMQRLDTGRQLPIGIIMADLNDLKLVNDTFGHEVGDEMLKHIAEILRNSCRKEDIIARWGGDEFVIFLPQTTEEDVNTICKRINERCKVTYVKDIPLSLALGSAIKNSTDKNLAEILKEAEENMYKHKLAGNQRLRSTVLNTLLKNLEAKSFETEAHYSGMQNVAQRIGKKTGLSESELSKLKILIPLHDIGEVNISEEILNKKGPLTAGEWEIIRKHPETGYRIVRATEEFAHVAGDILSHHERWDGSGYPQGLKGKEIPLLARITAIADAYEVNEYRENV